MFWKVYAAIALIGAIGSGWWVATQSATALATVEERAYWTKWPDSSWDWKNVAVVTKRGAPIEGSLSIYTEQFVVLRVSDGTYRMIPRESIELIRFQAK